MWETFWQNLTQIYPPVIWAFLVFLFGWFISKWIATLVNHFLGQIRLNQTLRSMGWGEALLRVDIKLDIEKFFGEIVRWFFIIIFLMLSFEILGLKQFSGFLGNILNYYPNIFIACLLFLGAVFLTNFSKKIVIGTLEKEKIVYSSLISRLAFWPIWLLTSLAILYQLKIVPDLILTVFVGTVITFALVIGISFGLGGKDLAQKILKELEEKFK